MECATTVAVERGDDGRVRARFRAGLLAPRVVGSVAGRTRIALVATSATLLGGDEVTVQVRVGEGCDLELVDVAATVAYDGRGESAGWRLEIVVGAGATLRWAAAPLVVSAGARVHRGTDVAVALGGRLLLRDTLVLGRTGERSGELDCRTRMTLGGLPALAEDLRLDREIACGTGVLAGARVVDTVTALGWRPDPVGDIPHFELAAEGALTRALVYDAHTSPAGAVFESWAAELSAPPSEFPCEESVTAD